MMLPKFITIALIFIFVGCGPVTTTEPNSKNAKQDNLPCDFGRSCKPTGKLITDYSICVADSGKPSMRGPWVQQYSFPDGHTEILKLQVYKYSMSVSKTCHFDSNTQITASANATGRLFGSNKFEVMTKDSETRTVSYGPNKNIVGSCSAKISNGTFYYSFVGPCLYLTTNEGREESSWVLGP